MLAAHDVNGDRQLDYQEFTNFISQFMAAAGFQLTDVLDDLVTLAQTKVRRAVGTLSYAVVAPAQRIQYQHMPACRRQLLSALQLWPAYGRAPRQLPCML